MACATCNNSGLSKVTTVKILCPDCRGIKAEEEISPDTAFYDDYDADLDFEYEYDLSMVNDRIHST